MVGDVQIPVLTELVVCEDDARSGTHVDSGATSSTSIAVACSSPAERVGTAGMVSQEFILSSSRMNDDGGAGGDDDCQVREQLDDVEATATAR